MKKIFSIVSAFVLFATLSAQAQTITFDTDDYKAVGVYDGWEGSPFRTGELKGNAAVVNNHLNQVDEVLGTAPDPSAKILAVQRSRFGGNTFGVRVDLKEPFRLTKNNRYAHVMINKPVESRVMVIGLGKRTEDAWSWQDGETEQFWAISAGPVAANKWVDVVVSFKGFSYADTNKGGIDIYSLVIVPDLRSPHADDADFACYIDEIVIDDSNESRFSTETYAVNFDKSVGNQRSDRFMTSVGLTGGTISPQTKTLTKDHHYYDLTTSTIFSAKPGDTLTPTYGYNGTWMNTDTYIDFGNDGKFSYGVNADGTPAEGSDIVSYQYSDASGSFRNSLGQSVSGGNFIGSASPSFTLPTDMANGLYRMRYKVDWNCIDPAGNTASGNEILANGGGIVDVLLDIHGDEVKVTQGALNGKVVDAEGNDLENYTTAYGQPFTIKMEPATGFTFDGVIVKSGYEVGGEQITGLNPNYIINEYPAKKFDANGCLTLPADVMVGGEVFIEGIFVQAKDEPVVDPTMGKDLTSLAELDNGKVYAIHSSNDEGYLCYNEEVNGAYVSIVGVKNDGSGVVSDATAKEAYHAEYEKSNPDGQWQIVLFEDNYYLYNLGAKQFVTRENRDYFFSEDTPALDGIRENGNGTFSFHAGGGMSDNSTYWACVVTNEPRMALRNWTWNDHGSTFVITELEGLTTYEALVKLGGEEPKPQYDTTTKYFNAEQLRAEAANGTARIGILGVTRTGNNYITGATPRGTVSEDNTLEGARAPEAEEVLEVIPTEGGYLLRLESLEEGEGYLSCAAGGDFSLVGEDNANVWEIAGPEDENYGTISNFDDMYTDIPAEVNELMVRFISNGQYMNGQANGSIGGLRGGTGAWSFNYIYNANYEEGEDDPTVGIGTVLAPEATQGIFNLQGIRLGNSNERGIRIVGGRKVIK